MVVKSFVDKSYIHAAKLTSIKDRFLRSSKVRKIKNNKGSRNRNEGVGQRLQIVTKNIGGEDLEATRAFTLAQKNLLNACRDSMGTDGSINLVETVLLSKDKSTVIQTPHPDLDPDFDSEAVLAFVSLEDHTTLIIYANTHNWKENAHQRRIGRRYAGDALLFHPSCIHAGDSYVTSNIRLHYYAFKAGTDWEEDSAYDLPTERAQQLTHSREVTSKTVKRTLCARESNDRDADAKRQKGDQEE